ncbi:hypothetical protein HH214_01470 [Mucilaginibacter robiniae]|uniref:Uncharacterized protein n=1 Tax=Mucilaginibacter robiniae TaxID=2728022 RepID=A0A7L5DV88_9SPHI|nr:hypothetical protein [Mucilaginibacter robiniae]QJD94631.1 hypothetical protein HH214_01470 [Mucilaginibacter robiniae]
MDTVHDKFEIAKMLNLLVGEHYGRNRVQYWMGFGNSCISGQVILSTLGNISQSASELYWSVEKLPLVTEEFKKLLTSSEQDGDTPSCSLAKALTKPSRTCSLILRWLTAGFPCCGSCFVKASYFTGDFFNLGIFVRSC